LNTRPVITGIGLVTPLGRSAPATFEALLAGRFISDHAKLHPLAAPDVHPGLQGHAMPRVTSLAIEATKEAIAQSNWLDDREQIAVVACTSKGSIEDWMNAPVTRASGPCELPANDRACDSPNSPAWAGGPCHGEAFGLSDLSASIANHIGSVGPRLCLSAACASGLHGLIRAAMLIQSGMAKRVLVVAAEASVHPLFLASFRRLGVLPPAGQLCRPFDRNRSGFLMSEAAAAICLEASEGQPHLVAIDRYALAGDASHLTASDPSARVLKHVLRNVTGDSPIDLIHAHGTGTLANDEAEMLAFGETLCGERILYSHKAALGHSLGASGLLAVAINCLCHQRGIVPGNINTIDPMDGLPISRSPIRRTIHRSLIHAAGFGGPTAVVSLIR
jgi:3-oxoacyl-[acyl-carrier-protein] synthase II